MGALELIGGGVVFTIGVVIGAAIMYGFETFMDWKENRHE